MRKNNIKMTSLNTQELQSISGGSALDDLWDIAKKIIKVLGSDFHPIL